MSKEAAMHFAEALLSGSAFLRDNCHDVKEFMDPEQSLPISRLGSFGFEIARNFTAIPPDEWTLLSAAVEQGLASDDEDVGTAVATGLIEALIHYADSTENLWPGIEAGLGPRARAYADAYHEAE